MAKYKLLNQITFENATLKIGKVIDSNQYNIDKLLKAGANLQSLDSAPDTSAIEQAYLQGNAPDVENTKLASLSNSVSSDNVATTLTELTSKAFVSNLGVHCLVYFQQLDRYYNWVKGDQSYEDSTRIIADDDNTGRFIYIDCPSTKAINQTTWYIGFGGDDFNDGQTADTALNSFGEWLVRTGGKFYNDTTIYLTADPDDVDLAIAPIYGNVYGIRNGDQECVLNIVGIPKTVESLDGALFTESDLSNGVLTKVQVPDFTFDTSYKGKSLMTVDRDKSTFIIKGLANEYCDVAKWSDPTGNAGSSPDTDTAIEVVQLPKLGYAVMKTDHTQCFVVFKNFLITNLYQSSNVRTINCSIGQFQGSNKCDVKSCWVTNYDGLYNSICDIGNSVVAAMNCNKCTLTMYDCYFFGNNIFSNCNVLMQGENYVGDFEDSGSLVSFVLLDGTVFDASPCSVAIYENSTIDTQYSVNTGSLLKIPNTSYGTPNTADFIVDGSSSHIPPLVGGELAVPSAVTCNTFTILQASPFDGYMHTYKTGSSVIVG